MQLRIQITEEDHELLIWALLMAQIMAENLDDDWRARRFGYLALKVGANGQPHLPTNLGG